MSDARCPECGRPVSPNAVVCPQCGFPIRGTTRAEWRGGGQRSQARTVIVAVAAISAVMLVALGVLAALVMPRVNNLTARINEQQGETLLRVAYAAERDYHADRGRYAADPGELPRGSRMDRNPLFVYALEISRAGGDELCMEAVPRRNAGRHARRLSMDERGNLYRAAGCAGEPEAGSDKVHARY